MFKVLAYNKRRELEHLLNAGWRVCGALSHNGKVVVLLQK